MCREKLKKLRAAIKERPYFFQGCLFGLFALIYFAITALTVWQLTHSFVNNPESFIFTTVEEIRAINFSAYMALIGGMGMASAGSLGFFMLYMWIMDLFERVSIIEKMIEFNPDLKEIYEETLKDIEEKKKARRKKYRHIIDIVIGILCLLGYVCSLYLLAYYGVSYLVSIIPCAALWLILYYLWIKRKDEKDGSSGSS